MKRSYEELIVIVGVLGSIATIIALFNVSASIITILAISSIIAFIKIYKKLKSRTKGFSLLFGRHPGLYAGLDLIKGKENSEIKISRMVKNIKYSDNNRTSNVTYIIDGEVVESHCTGIYLSISAGSQIKNITKIGYSLIQDETKKITNDDFHFIDNANIDILIPYNNQLRETGEFTPYAKKFYLPFPTCFEKGKTFQAILYYTWENTILDLTDSTSYYTKNLFPKGIERLITNLVFTSKPLEVIVYKAQKDKKQIFSKVENIRQIDDIFIVRWEIENPADTFILQRTLEKWS